MQHKKSGNPTLFHIKTHFTILFCHKNNIKSKQLAHVCKLQNKAFLTTLGITLGASKEIEIYIANNQTIKHPKKQFQP